MSEENPYQAPEAPLTPPPMMPENGDQKPLNLTKVAASNGWAWITQGWNMVKSEPLLWIVAFVSMFGVYFILSTIPLVSIAAPVVVPIIGGGIMFMAMKQDKGLDAKLEDIFAGFNDKAGSLAGLGLLNLGASIVIMIIVVIIFAVFGGMAFISGGMDMNNVDVGMMLPAFFIAGLFMAVLFMLVGAGMWFAPALIMLNDMDVMAAFTTSFKAVYKNWLAFLVYGLAVFVLAIIGSIPLFIGLLVLAPVLIASSYTAYKDVFDQ
ncbi:MAG: BPSS1780 family membrane protein [bacterium]